MKNEININLIYQQLPLNVNMKLRLERNFL